MITYLVILGVLLFDLHVQEHSGDIYWCGLILQTS